MKAAKKSIIRNLINTAAFSLLGVSALAYSAVLAPVVDDFDNASNTSQGMPRMSISDTSAGGQTTTELAVTSGVIQVKGEIVPPRGQPGWSSLVLPLGPMGEAQDASQFSGVRLLVKVNQGNLSISANSLDVTNFDYHAAPLIVSANGAFHEIKIPFADMKRMWSEQTALNPETLNSLSIVAFSVQRAAYDFEVDEVSFY